MVIECSAADGADAGAAEGGGRQTEAAAVPARGVCVCVCVCVSVCVCLREREREREREAVGEREAVCSVAGQMKRFPVLILYVRISFWRLP